MPKGEEGMVTCQLFLSFKIFASLLSPVRSWPLVLEGGGGGEVLQG